MTTFLRLLQADDKEAALRAAVEANNRGQPTPDVFHLEPRSFRQVPGSPFAYWVSEQVLALFTEFPKLNSEGREAWKGLITGYDFQWVRLAWEVPLDSHGRSREDTRAGKGWVPYAKGGEYATYYTDLHLVVNWNRDGKDISEWKLTELELGRITANNSGCWNRTKYFRPGLTWSGRSQQGLSFRALPRGSIFGNKGPGVFAANDDTSVLAAYLGLVNSSPFRLLVSLQMAFGSFEVGVIQRTPFPPIDPDSLAKLESLVSRVISEKRRIDENTSTSHAFVAPALLMVPGNTLLQRVAAWSECVGTSMKVIKTAEDEIDSIAFRIYGIADISEELSRCTQGAGHNEGNVNSQGSLDDEDSVGSDKTSASTDASWHTGDLVAYAVGAIFGRWNLMVALKPRVASAAGPSAFDPLSVCPPGMLRGEDGLTLTGQPATYSISIDRDGILVDDSDHPDDVVRRVRDVLEVIWKVRAEAIEKEACQILGVKELRDYFRKPGNEGFWNDHISRYSKSRRKAPIYWLLQSSKKNYAVWLYYHRLDKDLLFKALVNYVEPKIQRETNRLDELRREKAALTPNPSPGGRGAKGAKKLDKELERQEDLISELRDFEDKLRRAANLHLEPDLNDGVVLNIAPLHELVPWKEAKKYWKELLEGKYEWSSIGKQLREKGLVK